MATEPANQLRALGEDQLAAFDTDYVYGEMWPHINRLVEVSFPDGCFSFVDLGGGNGRFADTLLDRFPHSSCVLVDSAESLLALNSPHPRKTLAHHSIETCEAALAGARFDLVCFHWVLHHFVAGSFGATRAFQQQALEVARGLLTDRGRVSVFENLYEGFVFDSLPGRTVYELTSSTAFAPVAQRLGANTAGVGVCFLSERQWERAFSEARLALCERRRFSPLDFPSWKRRLLFARAIQHCHFWLADTDAHVGLPT